MSVEDLVEKLKMSNDPSEKRKLRAKLRAMGHRGGTGAPRQPGAPRAASAPVVKSPLDMLYFSQTPPEKIPDGRLLEAMRHPDMKTDTTLWKLISGEWNARRYREGKSSRPMGKGNLDKDFADIVRQQPVGNPKNITQLKQKKFGRRAIAKAVDDLPIGTLSKPPMRGRLCMNCEQTCVWDHRTETWKCPKCHPEELRFEKFNWPTDQYNLARRMLPENLSIGFAPDYGWFVYKDAPVGEAGYQRIGDFTPTEKGPVQAVKNATSR